MDFGIADSAIPDFVIVAGGQARRLEPLTARVAKVLLPVAGKPIIDHQLDWLCKQGVQRVVLCLGRFAEKIESYVRSSEWDSMLEIVVSNEGEAMLGTAGAVNLAIERGLLNEKFLTLYGDTIPQFEVQKALRVWKQAELDNMLCVFDCGDFRHLARANVRGDRVVQFARQPTSEAAAQMMYGDYGVAGFNQDAFAHLKAGSRSGFGQIHSSLAKNAQLLAIKVLAPPIEIGTHSQLEYANTAIWESQGNYVPISNA